MRHIACCGLLIACCTVVQSGCGTSDAPAKSASPAEVVRQFLTAVKAADNRTAESLLTVLAQEMTEEMDLLVDPPGSDTASFEIGQVARVSDTEAHVASTWTELDEDGQPRTDEIIWDLRRHDQGWRIAGMSTTVFEGEPPLYLNFEDPADMMRKQRLVEQEMQRRSGEMAPQGSGAAGGQAAVPRAGQGDPSSPVVPNDRTAAKLPSERRELPRKRTNSNPGAPRSRGNNAPQGRFDG